MRPLFGFWGIKVVANWKVATSVWVLGIRVATWQVETSVWVLGDQGCCNLPSCDLCLGSGGSMLLQPAKLRLLFGFWGIKVTTWPVATSVWVLGNKSRLNLTSGDLCLGSGGSRSLQPAKLRLLFGFWGIRLSCMAWAPAQSLSSRRCLPADGSLFWTKRREANPSRVLSISLANPDSHNFCLPRHLRSDFSSLLIHLL